MRGNLIEEHTDTEGRSYRTDLFCRRNNEFIGLWIPARHRRYDIVTPVGRNIGLVLVKVFNVESVARQATIRWVIIAVPSGDRKCRFQPETKTLSWLKNYCSIKILYVALKKLYNKN